MFMVLVQRHIGPSIALMFVKAKVLGPSSRAKTATSVPTEGIKAASNEAED
jgi:hypothetical protein